MAYGGLINAFSSGLVDGARAGALMDATFADQDQRELESQARDVKGFVDYLAASGNDFNKALETPEGQQMAYRAMAANPAVRKSLASAPGFKPTGMVRGPDGRFAFVGQDDNGNIRPLSVGGKAVTYDSNQLMAMTAASAGQLGVENSAQQFADVEQLSQQQQGDVFDTLEKQGLGPAVQLRQMAQQGQQFIEQGGIPVQKGGVPAVRQAIRAEIPKTAAKSAEAASAIKGDQGSPEKARLEVPDMLRRQEPAKGSDDPLQLTGKSFSDIRREAAPTLTEQKEKVAQNREDRRARLEAEYQQAFDESSLPRDVGAAARAVVDTAGDVGEFVGRGVDYFRRNVTKPAAAAVEKGLEKAAEIPAKVKEGFTGEKAPVAQTAAGPVATSKAPGKTPAVVPQSTVEKAVAKQHLSPKMVTTPEKLEQVDAAFVKQIKSEPLQTRVQNDGTALERLAKLGQGKKPNSAQLHAVFRLVKSGLLTPAAAAMFRETGKLDNTAFDNAYKEHNVRQNYIQLQQADNRLAFDKYKEVNDQARHLQGVRLTKMKQEFLQAGKDEKAAKEAAEALDKKGRALLVNSVASEFRRMPSYKDMTESVIKSEAETAVEYMMADGQYVAPMLDGRTVPTSMPDYVALSEAIPQLVGRRFGEDGVFSSSVAATPVYNKFKNAGREVIGVQK